jgi:uncharacterized membrane protein YgcG
MHRVFKVATQLLVASLAATGAWATDAPEVTDNPLGVQYLAEMPSGGDQGVIAQFSVATLSDGSAVTFAVNINGAPFSGGPFRKTSRALNNRPLLTIIVYHIHDQPVPSNGNCTATNAHLDPYNRGEDPPCNQSDPGSCQVGDLSGKHGKIPALPGFSANYTDSYFSLTPGAPAFFGNRSVVLHYANKTRIACANFKIVESNSTTNGNGSYFGGSSPSSSSSLPLSTSGGGGSSSTTSGSGGSVPSGGTKSEATGQKMMSGSTVLLGPILAIFAVLVL